MILTQANDAASGQYSCLKKEEQNLVTSLQPFFTWFTAIAARSEEEEKIHRQREISDERLLIGVVILDHIGLP